MATPAISELNARAAGALRRIKPAERRLLGLVLLAGLMFLPIKMLDMRQKALDRLTAAQTELEMGRQALSRVRGAAGGQAAEQKSGVQAWTWHAESVEVGKVMIQYEMAALAAKAGLVEPEVKVTDKVEDAGEAQLVRLEITAPFSWTGFSAFLAGLEATGKGFVLDTVQLPDDDKPHMKIVLRAPLQVTAPTAPAKAAPVAAPKKAAL